MKPLTHTLPIPVANPAPDSPLITIAMPVRNNQRTLDLAIRSILDQTYLNWELLLIDDGSTDRTLEIARSYHDLRIKIISDGRSLGLAHRLNEAIEAACGSYIARMDGDDVAYPQRLERQLAYLQSHPGIDLVGSWVLVFDRDGNPLGKRAGPEQHEAITSHPHSGFLIVHPTFMASAEWFRANKYDQTMGYSQDQDLLLRAHSKSRFANVPEILLGYREEQINLKKLITSRRNIATRYFAYFRRHGQWLLAVRSLAAQALRASVDVAAVATGLRYRLLRQRARTTTPAEEAQWQAVWKNLNRHD